jgi:hypothetical protein
MALFQENYLRNLASQRLRNDNRYKTYSTESANDSLRKSILLESSVNFSAGKRSFDIFLSHSYSDKELILGVREALEKFRYSVYIDWIDDSGMDRANITKESVLWIKERMKASKCLIYATSSNSSSSKWMPWELGFMDGFKDKVVILPVSQSYATSYKGHEYLGIYPYLEMVTMSNINYLRVTDQQNQNLSYDFSVWLSRG